MSTVARTGRAERTRRPWAGAVESLEGRALLAVATEAFTGPSLTDLIALARQGHNTAPAGINRMLQALQTQLTNGPLADLNSGTATASDFVTEVQNLAASYEQNVDQQLLPEFPNVDRLLKLQGERITADVAALGQQNRVGLLSTTNLPTEARTAINSLTGGPLRSLGTPVSALVDRTTSFEDDLHTLAQSLAATATPSLTLDQVNTTLQAEANAYRADLDAALRVTHPRVAAQADAAVAALVNQANSIAQAGGTGAQSQLNDAITTFDTAVLDTTGLFGPQGPVQRAHARAGG